VKRLLAAVDGSLASIHAAKLAVEIAAGTGGEVTLIYVGRPSLRPGEAPLTPPAQLHEAELAEGARILRAVAGVLEPARVKTLNRLGSPADVIAEEAVDGGYDLVVAGSKGRGAVNRVLVGSVADRLVHVCPRPIIVVR